MAASKYKTYICANISANAKCTSKTFKLPFALISANVRSAISSDSIVTKMVFITHLLLPWECLLEIYKNNNKKGKKHNLNFSILNRTFTVVN